MVDEHKVTARNTAVAHENKMHDDTVAATFGFRGGLVPGVDVYAYLCNLPAARWGADWVERGAMQGRFVSPVYDGEQIVVTAELDDDGAMQLAAVGPDGVARATGTATLSDGSADDGEEIPLVEAGPRSDRPPASTDSLPDGLVLASTDIGFHGERAGEYLDDIDDHLDVYRSGRFAHPGWLLREANYVLAATVRLGPWIHVSSACRHHGLVGDGDRVTTRARVRGTFERKGHRFVELDVQWKAGPTGSERTVMRAHHVAIYEPAKR